jgi:hypothetical protein
MPRSKWPLLVIVPLLPILALLGPGCGDILNLDDYGVAEPPPPDGEPNFYTCRCTCNAGGVGEAERDLVVCLPAGLNPVLDPTLPAGFVPTVADLEADCRGRVRNTFEELARRCILRLDCSGCDPLIDLRYAAECNQPCTEELLIEPGCPNFDPATGNKTATNSQGEVPVCFVASADPPVPTPEPLAASGIFGRRSTCAVAGDVTATFDDDAQTQGGSGVIEFTGGPCPGQSCATGMAYRLNVDPFEFSAVLGLVSVELKDVVTVGASVPGGAVVDVVGAGQFPFESTFSSGRGTRVDTDPFGEEVTTGVLVGTNVEPVGIVADWTNHMCAMNGTVLGSIGQGSELAVTVDLHGTLVNQPPEANASATDQTVECTSPTSSAVALDASASTDPDANLQLVGWRRGSRSAPDPADEFGPGEFGDVLAAQQTLGTTEEYFLKVIDAFMQMSEDAVSVSVVDTTPPTISGIGAAPALLWPPNHKMRRVDVAVVVSDVCDPDPHCSIVDVASDEPVDGAGDGHTSPDWMVASDLTVDLRAERAGPGDGRVYTITVDCTDDFANTATATTAVMVPHDRS